MQCLKCGKKTEEKQVFCSACLADMACHPVKPDTAIHIPHREPYIPKKRHRELTTEEINAQLRSMIRWLTVTVGVLALLICLLAGLLIQSLQKDSNLQAIGKNYTTADQNNQPVLDVSRETQ